MTLLSNNRSKTARSYAAPLLVAAVVAAGCLIGREFLPFVSLAENWVSDLRVARLTPPRPQNQDIAVITVTDETLSAFPYRSPLDRKFLSRLLRTLERKGARAIGVDVLFDQPTEPEKDAELYRTLRSLAIPVVVGRVDDGVGLTDGQLAYLNRFLEGVPSGLALLAKNNFDGKVRSTFLGQQEDGFWRPSFVVALAREVGATIPEGGHIALDYYGNPNASPPPFPVFPAHSLAVLPDAWIAGKIVLIGADLTLEDRHRTPFDIQHRRSAGMPGVLVHAHGLAQLLDGRRTKQLAGWLDAAFVLLFAAAGILLALIDLSLVARAGIAAVATALLWTAGFMVYQRGGPIVPLVTPTMALALAAASQMALRWQGERSQKQFIRHAFSRFLAPSIVAKLVAQPDALSVVGEKRIVTSLFTDIANFTSVMESSDPAIMVPVLNNYLDEACKIVHKHGGTIDKIVGDALVVFFNAPIDQPDHADRAVACAIDLDNFSQDYRARQAERGIELGCTRIGIHTGPAVVGNFGGFERFAYTAYGDTINTAARFESANKYFGTRVCIGAQTVEQSSRFKFRPIGSIVLKGKSEAVDAFEPIPESEASSPKNVAYLDAYRRLVRDGGHAADAFADLASRHPEDALIQFHARRLKAWLRGENKDDAMFGSRIVLADK